MPTPDPLADLVDRMPDLDKGVTESGRRRQKVEGKLTGPPWPEAVKDVCDPVLAGGTEAVLGLIDMLKPVADGSDYKVRYTLHGLSVYACRKGKEKQRAAVIAAYTAALGQDRPAPVKEFLVWELETVGDERAADALAALLDDPTVGPDAVRSLLAVREGAAERLRAALPRAKGPMRLHLVQALGRLKDTASVPALKKAAGDPDADVRLAAVEALAAIGDPGSAEVCLKAVEADGWHRIKAAGACLLLAETLADAGSKADAKDVYGRLKKACGGEDEAHLRDACDRGLKAVG